MLFRIKAIAKKEIKQLSRDKRMMFVLFFFPVFLLIIFGYAVNYDVRNVKLAVLDNDRTSLSREFVNDLSSSSYFDIVEKFTDDKNTKEILDEGKAKAVLVIPKGFSRDIYANKESAKLQFLLDGVDGNTAAIIQNYSLGAVQSFNEKLLDEVGGVILKEAIKVKSLQKRYENIAGVEVYYIDSLVFEQPDYSLSDTSIFCDVIIEKLRKLQIKLENEIQELLNKDSIEPHTIDLLHEYLYVYREYLKSGLTSVSQLEKMCLSKKERFKKEENK